MTITLAQVIAALDAAYPPALAQVWDTGIGLTCGDPAAPVATVLLAVDVEPRTVDEAIRLGVDLLLTHHPLLFRPVQSVAADTAKGAMVHRLITAGIAHFAAHTNADLANRGVNDALARALGLARIRPLQPAAEPAMDKLVVFVPVDHTAGVIEALAAAGAGRVGDYSHAAFYAEGTGQFRPLSGANPAIGQVDRLERVPETRVDMVLRRADRARVVAALRAAHPYEEPGFDITEMVRSPSANTGMGRIGELAEPVALGDFAERVVDALPATATGARVAGDPGRLISLVAVCGGAGSSLLPDAAAAGVDAFVTSDLTHHLAAEFAAEPDRPALVEVAHWAGEWPWLAAAADELGAAFRGEVGTVVSRICTDPWALRSGGSAG